MYREPQMVRDYLVSKSHQSICSLDIPVGKEEDDTLASLLEDTQTPQPFESLVRQELKETLEKLLGELDPRHSRVLRLRFGMEDGVCYSQSETCKMLDISKERVRQIEQQAIKKLIKRSAGLGLSRMNLDISFAAWESELEKLAPGEKIDALHLLAITEDDSLEDALEVLEEKGIGITIDSLDRIPVAEETALRLRREKELVEKNALLTGLSDTDPLRVYLEELAGLPVAGDLQILAERYAAGDESVMSRLTDGMLSLVVEKACALSGRGVLSCGSASVS